LESKTVMSAGVSTAPVAAAAAQEGPGPVTPPFLVETPLNGTLQGSYTSPFGLPDTGKTFNLNGSGQVSPLGQVSVTGSLQAPGFILSAHASGTLTLQDAAGTITLKVSGKSATSNGQLPGAFTYTTQSGTGAYAHWSDDGTLAISLNPSSAGATPTSPGNGQFTITVTSSHINTVNLAGQAAGHYNSTQNPPDTGTKYKLNAIGTITPIGEAVVTGSFQTPGFIKGGQAKGTLTVVGTQGTLTLKLTAAGPIPPGSASAPASMGPIVLQNNFTYQITRGTGIYSHAHGSGTVDIMTTPSLTGPIGPGVFGAASATRTGVGRTTLTFTPGLSTLG
jgi:hypothetical protein